MDSYNDMPDILTISELQMVLRVGRSTAYRLVKSKDIQSIRIGRSIRIPKQFVEKYLQSQGVVVEDERGLCYNSINATARIGACQEKGV